VFGTCAVTAVTAQNTLGVTLVEVLSPEMVAAQIDAVASDLRPAATKLGMLASADIVRTAAAAIGRHQLSNVVLDTVMVAKAARGSSATTRSRPCAGSCCRLRIS
jgi:hydroxymethylpyrimidine/phosphomethylpyrimidine kinase